MEEWIFIVLAFAWIVLSAVIGRKKKKPKTPPKDFPKEIFETFGDDTSEVFTSLDDFFNHTKNSETKTANIEAPITVKNTLNNEKTTPQNVKNSPFEKNFTKKINPITFVDEFEDQDVGEKNSFNLREAIIFSEILRTPYID